MKNKILFVVFFTFVLLTSCSGGTDDCIESSMKDGKSYEEAKNGCQDVVDDNYQSEN